jgi:hypothetical protein
MTAEERLQRFWATRPAAAAVGEIALLESHGLRPREATTRIRIADAVERLRRKPRRRCVCARHRAAGAA